MLSKPRQLAFRCAALALTTFICLLVGLLAELVLKIQRSTSIAQQIEQIEQSLKDKPTAPQALSDEELVEAIVRSNATYGVQQFAGDDIPLTVHRPYIEHRQTPGRVANDLGYRGKSFGITKPENTFRILMYGGSFVWGTGVLNPTSTIPAHLELLLNANSASKKRVEVINCGDFNYCSTQEVVYLLVEGVYLSPDLVIFLDGVNDTAGGYTNLPAGYHGDWYEMNALLQRGQSLNTIFTTHELDHLRREQKAIFNWQRSLLLNRVQRLLGTKAKDDHRKVGEPDWPDNTPPNLRLVPEFRHPEEYALRHFYNYRSILALGKQFGFESIFFTQPVPVLAKPLSDFEKRRLRDLRRNDRYMDMELTYWEDHYATYLDALVARCQEHDYPLVDLRNIFSNYSGFLYIDDCHLTDQGYEMVAERINRELRERKLVHD